MNTYIAYIHSAEKICLIQKLYATMYKRLREPRNQYKSARYYEFNVKLFFCTCSSREWCSFVTSTMRRQIHVKDLYCVEQFRYYCPVFCHIEQFFLAFQAQPTYQITMGETEMQMRVVLLFFLST